MTNTLFLPFELVRNASDTLTDPQVQSQLLLELAQQQLATEQFDAALQTFAAIPDPQERRIALLVSDFHFFPPEKAETLVRLLDAAPQTSQLAGRLALAMLDANNTKTAWKLIETAAEPFESDQQQYDFLEKILPLLQEEEWNKIPRFYRSFIPGMFRDWAALAILKSLTPVQRYDEAEKYAETLVLPLRHSWAYWEMSRLTSEDEKQSKTYFDKSLDLAEGVEIVENDEETMEILAVQLRIFGRTAFEKGERERGLRLLNEAKRQRQS